MLDTNQTNAIKSWSEQRDTLLLEISHLKTTKENLTKSNVELANSNSEIQNSISYKRGKLDTLDLEEKNRNKIVSKELYNLIVNKSKVEINKANLTKDVEELSAKKKSLQDDINSLIPVYDRVTWQVEALNDTISHVVRVNTENIKDVNILISDMKSALQNNLEK